MQELQEDASGEQQPDETAALEHRVADVGWSLRRYRKVARRCSQITPAEYRILDALLDFADWSSNEPAIKDPFDGTDGAGGNCFPRRKEIAHGVGVTPRAVDPKLKSLEKKGWLTRIPFLDVRRGSRASDLYQFRIPSQLGGDDTRYAGMRGPLNWSNRPPHERPAKRGHKFWNGRPWPFDEDGLPS